MDRTATDRSGLELAGRTAVRVLDILVAAVVLLLTAPLLAMVVIAIRMTSREPALRSEVRVGRQGVPFRMLGLRTTTVDGGRRAADRADHTTDGRPLVTRRADARTSRLGRVLRATSVDELPRFWNVLRGDMSLVGPCPRRPAESDRNRGGNRSVEQTVTVRPGLTGLWRISETPIDDRSPMQRGRRSASSA